VSRAARSPVLLLWLATGCAYYNGMWSAERFARDARRQEARGQPGEARLNWAQAAVRAESVLVRHPTSRWANDALVLQGEALARSGACDQAAAPLRQALQQISDDGLRGRASLMAARCAMDSGNSGAVDGLLAPVFAGADPQQRSEAAAIAGRAALARGDARAAVDLLRRSQVSGTRLDRARALVALGQTSEAVALLDSVRERPFDETRWSAALADLADRSGAGAASGVLDRLLASSRVPGGVRARLLLADGDRRRGERDYAAAQMRYTAAATAAPDSVAGSVARVHTLEILVLQSENPADLTPVRTQLDRLTSTRGALTGSGLTEAENLSQTLTLLSAAAPTDIDAFRAAELARDSLGASHLAATMFLQFVARRPTSLFAPKALLAAASLRPAVGDSIRAVIDSQYATSPYTLALHGTTSPAFAVIEDSLALALGLSRVAIRAAVTLTVLPPRTGPRGPELDPADEGVQGTSAGLRPTRGVRPTRPGARPTTRPDTRPDERP
jgi:tetratricopeptide (TPR) repeat protein